MAVVLDGVVYYRESEYNAILSELLQRREEVSALMRERDELHLQLEQRKPVLPRKVAEALELAKKHWFNAETVAWNIPLDSNQKGFRKVLFEHADPTGGFFELIDALRYGYMVEEPTIRDEIRAIAEDCDGNRERMIERLADLFQARLEQEMQKSG
jgi:hypothetical protein